MVDASLQSQIKETLDALQRLEQGQMQALGDELLPLTHPSLRGLQSYGLSAEGKTRKGTPDSFVGASPSLCTAAVEYTTTGDPGQLEAKFVSDYDKLRVKCPDARVLVLCTNRPITNLDNASLHSQAEADDVALTVLGGEKIAVR